MTTPSPRGQYEQEQRQAFIERRARLMNGGYKPRLAPSPEPVIVQFHCDAANRPHVNRSKEIIDQVLWKHSVSKEAMKSQSRAKEVVRARQEACYRLRMEAHLTFPQISVLLGYEDHTTSLYGCRQHAARLAKDGARA